MAGDDDDAQKTEDPTPKKIEQARKKGQVALSRELNNWIMLLSGTILVAMFGPYVMAQLRDYLASFIAQAHMYPGFPNGLGEVARDGLLTMLAILGLPFLFLVVVAMLGPLIQVGPMFAPEAIKPDFSKISPLSGFKRLFSLKSIMEFLKGLLKITAVGIVGYLLLLPYYGQIEHFIGMPMMEVLHEMMALFVRLMTGILVVLVVVAIVDVIYQRIDYMKKMRMTKQEVKDEYKQSEGDPEIKARLRQLRQQKAMQRMMQNVPGADVVITNPTHFAIALKYDPDAMDAPVCVAKGIEEVALRIREVATEHHITIMENKPLARALYDTVELDQMIPAEHYKAVAEIISYVFKLKGKKS